MRRTRRSGERESPLKSLMSTIIQINIRKRNEETD